MSRSTSNFTSESLNPASIWTPGVVDATGMAAASDELAAVEACGATASAVWARTEADVARAAMARTKGANPEGACNAFMPNKLPALISSVSSTMPEMRLDCNARKGPGNQTVIKNLSEKPLTGVDSAV